METRAAPVSPVPAGPVAPAAPSGARRPFPAASELARHWDLDPSVCFLNHGSFGACPRAVLAEQSRLRARMEAEAVRFFVEEYEALIDAARGALAALVGARAEDLVFVPNATTGVATALENLAAGLRPGDEVLATTHEYPGCMTNLRRVAGGGGAVVVPAAPPFPASSSSEAVEAVLSKVTARTRLALVSHITAPSAMVLPVERIVPALEARGVVTIVDGAHAAGQVPLDLGALGASFYTANCHKWLCTPKGTAFLHIRPDRQAGFRPLVLSNSAEKPRPGRKHLLTEFDYAGTSDYTGWLSVPAAISTMASLAPGGWAGVMQRNHDLAVAARAVVCRALGVEAPAPEGMLGSMAAVFLPPHEGVRQARVVARPTRYHDALQDALLDRWRIQVPVWSIPGDARRLVRLSAQLYNAPGQYEYLAAALAEELAREREL
ncbi:MAG: aminotransferase class V-fold PLP-dependent enzyme [Phycisphaerales bacterium]